MEQLDKMYEALNLLKQLELPVSGEQLRTVKAAESKYIDEEIVPHLEEALAPLIDKLQSDFVLRVSYSKEGGLQVLRVEDAPKKAVSSTRKSPQKKFLLKVTFPDGTVFSDKKGSVTLLQVINKIGAEKAAQVEIPVMGVNLVSKKKSDNYRYSRSQYATNDGYYVMTYSALETKVKQIKMLSNQLELGLKVERVPIQWNQESELWDSDIENEQ